ncbi:hypothetical protein [Actinophytocola sediminis]
MRTYSRIVAAALVALATTVGIGTASATGAPTDAKAPEVVFTAAERQALQAQVDRHLGDYGGGEQVGINEIAYDDGKMILTIPLPGEKKPRAIDEPITAQGQADCAYLYACLWSGTNFTGTRLAHTACGTVTLSAPFNSSTASIRNAQSNGTQTMILNSDRQILNANLAPSTINDTGVGSRWFVRYWNVCP